MNQDQSLTLERIFNAPQELVWHAWTEPEHFGEWYGKPGNSLPGSVEMEVREGGRWKSTTVGSDGTHYSFSGTFREVLAPEKLIMTIENPVNPSDPNTELVTVALRDLDGKTEMTFKQEGNLPPEEYQTGLKDGWSGFFDHLEKHLDDIQNG